jgi:hypothetical protein
LLLYVGDDADAALDDVAEGAEIAGGGISDEGNGWRGN